MRVRRGAERRRGRWRERRDSDDETGRAAAQCVSALPYFEKRPRGIDARGSAPTASAKGNPSRALAALAQRLRSLGSDAQHRTRPQAHRARRPPRRTPSHGRVARQPSPPQVPAMLLQWCTLEPHGPGNLAAIRFSSPVRIQSISIFPTDSQPFAGNSETVACVISSDSCFTAAILINLYFGPLHIVVGLNRKHSTSRSTSTHIPLRARMGRSRRPRMRWFPLLLRTPEGRWISPSG